LEKPKGLPIAITGSPTIRSAELPGGVKGSDASARILSTAMSLFGSAPTSSASNSRPSAIVTRTRSARAITCSLVKTCPAASKITPEPRLCTVRDRGWKK